MSDDELASDELRISIESGSDYVPTPRLAAAIEELASALEAAEQGDQDDVAGFSFEPVRLQPGFSLNYVSPTTLSYTENDTKGKHKGVIDYSWSVER